MKNKWSLSIIALFVSASIYSAPLMRIESKFSNGDLSQISSEKPSIYVNKDGKNVENYQYNTEYSIFAIDEAYGVDTWNKSGKQISMNIYNKNYATGALKIYDSNGKVTRVIPLPGNAPETSIYKSYAQSMTNMVGKLTSEYEFMDSRSPGNSFDLGKLSVEFFVPEGGRIELSKNSPEAIIFNLLDIVLGPLLEKVIPDDAEDFYSKLAIHFARSYSISKLKFMVNTFLSRELSIDTLKDFGIELSSTMLDFFIEEGLEVETLLNVIASRYGEAATKKLLSQAPAKIAGVTISAAKEAAEGVATLLDAAGKLLDLQRNFDGKGNVIATLPSCKDNMNNSYCQTTLADNERARNLKRVLDTSKNKLIAQTSHIGSNNIILQNNKSNQRQTIQENPYLAKGSTIIEAPADIVLNWGANPADLDSHLTGPMGNNSQERFHVNFTAKGALDNQPNVLLYRDYTDHRSGGENLPEQTRINVTQPGIYNFYVHDYSNRNNENNRALSQSGAVVTVHTAGSRELPEGQNLGKEIARYSVPQNKEGTVWHSFELDTRRNTIREVGTFHKTTEAIK